MLVQSHRHIHRHRHGHRCRHGNSSGRSTLKGVRNMSGMSARLYRYLGFMMPTTPATIGPVFNPMRTFSSWAASGGTTIERNTPQTGKYTGPQTSYKCNGHNDAHTHIQTQARHTSNTHTLEEIGTSRHRQRPTHSRTQVGTHIATPVQLTLSHTHTHTYTQQWVSMSVEYLGRRTAPLFPVVTALCIRTSRGP